MDKLTFLRKKVAELKAQEARKIAAQKRHAEAKKLEAEYYRLRHPRLHSFKSSVKRGAIRAGKGIRTYAIRYASQTQKRKSPKRRKSYSSSGWDFGINNMGLNTNWDTGLI